MPVLIDSIESTAFRETIKTAYQEASEHRTKRVKVGTETAVIPVPYASAEDWRDKWIYFLMVDRFNNPDQPVPNWNQPCGTFMGGTLNGIRAQLDYLKTLGVGAIWISPVQRNLIWESGSYHGYGIQNFLAIDPRFASDVEAAKRDPTVVEDELRALVDEAHARGIYIILDIVLNHVGNVFGYAPGQANAANSEAAWSDTVRPVFWRDERGFAAVSATTPQDHSPNAEIGPLELRRNESFRRRGMSPPGVEIQGDFLSLKELATDYREAAYFPVRDALIRSYQYLIARFDIDGFRIDTLKHIEPETAQNFANAIREFALSIGKKNFFIFGEIRDNSEEKLAKFIGRDTNLEGDIVGVDAAIDFPVKDALAPLVKNFQGSSPGKLVAIYRARKNEEKDVITSHGEASQYFVTCLDNHDDSNYRFCPADPKYRDQLSMGLACLFSLQGIPCVYYGTEQALSGIGTGGDQGVREALWGKPKAFDRKSDAFLTIQKIAAVRQREPALRYGRQYFRPLSGDGLHFGISPYDGGVLAFSRILNDREVLVIANPNTDPTRTIALSVIVDSCLNHPGDTFEILYSNKNNPVQPQPIRRLGGPLRIEEVDGSIGSGPLAVVPVELQPMEVQILARKTV